MVSYRINGSTLVTKVSLKDVAEFEETLIRNDIDFEVVKD